MVDMLVEIWYNRSKEINHKKEVNRFNENFYTDSPRTTATYRYRPSIMERRWGLVVTEPI